MKNGPSSLNRDFGHPRPGDPGRVALVAPPGEASLVARRLGYRSARALRKAVSRRFPGGVLALRDRRLAELAKPLLRAAGVRPHHIEGERNSHVGTF